jgi:hypothetical protein
MFQSARRCKRTEQRDRSHVSLSDTARPIARSKGAIVMWGGIALVLIVLWLLGALAFKVTGAIIHVLLILAVVAVVLHFVRRAKV